MNISINKPNNLNKVLFKKQSDNQSLSDWMNFEFIIKKNINKTGLIFYLEINVGDFYFQNKNGVNNETFKFGKRKCLKVNEIIKRRVRFYTPNSLNDIDSMNFTVKLFSNLNQLMEEGDVILKVKTIDEDGN